MVSNNVHCVCANNFPLKILAFVFNKERMINVTICQHFNFGNLRDIVGSEPEAQHLSVAGAVNSRVSLLSRDHINLGENICQNSVKTKKTKSS